MEPADVKKWTRFVKDHLWLHRKQYDKDDVQECLLKALELESRGRLSAKTLSRWISNYCVKMNKPHKEIPLDMDTIVTEEEGLTIDLDELEGNAREIVEMFYLQGMALNQIAEELGLTIDV